MNTHYRPVRSLDAETARKIAAGEVIDRPAAVVRELLDNAIDSGATRVRLDIVSGGIEQIRVTDNGCGMTKDDLEICWQPHTTSKIQNADDLLSLSTLGFRGEALSSVAAVSQLEITTTQNGREAWQLKTHISAIPCAADANTKSATNRVEPQKCSCTILPSRLAEGTTVCVSQLFAHFPARKMFLKRSAAEMTVCKQAFIDKALAWPHCAFTFASDGAVKYTLRENDTYKKRCLDVLEPLEPPSFFSQIEGTGDGFSFSAVLGSPDVVRRDRRFVMIFINGRRVSEYSLMQAIEYGAEGSFPNGTHPFACLFLTIDSSLIDINIHPAKKEVRFKDSSAVHHAVSSAVRSFYRQERIASGTAAHTYDSAIQQPLSFEPNGGRPAFHTKSGTMAEQRYPKESIDIHDAVSRLLSRKDDFKAASSFDSENADSAFDTAAVYGESINQQPDTIINQHASSQPRYIGQLFNVFLAAEYGGSFYLIDQHAAHERILYNALMETCGTSQELLIPYLIETDSSYQDTLLQEIQSDLHQAGFVINQDGSQLWNVSAVPIRWTGTEEQLKDDIIHAGTCGTNRMNELMALAACRQAVKEGDMLDNDTATKIVQSAFALPEPYCPHGRPIWAVFSKDDIYRFVKRT